MKNFYTKSFYLLVGKTYASMCIIMMSEQRFTMLAILSGLILLLTAYFWPLWKFNEHVVILNRLYRSAQLCEPELTHVVERNHIRSIINLRGKHLSERWYQDEIALSQKNQLTHFDLEMPAHGRPTQHQLMMLVQALLTAPQPILVHCKNGVDRTGLASALGLILLGNASMSEVKKQYTPQYLNLSEKSVARLAMADYERWLKEKNVPSSRASLMKWVSQYS